MARTTLSEEELSQAIADLQAARPDDNGITRIRNAADELEPISQKSEGFLSSPIGNLQEFANGYRNVQERHDALTDAVQYTRDSYASTEGNIGQMATSMGAGMNGALPAGALGGSGALSSPLTGGRTLTAPSFTPSTYTPSSTPTYTPPEYTPTTYTPSPSPKTELTTINPTTKTPGTTSTTGTTATPSSLKSAVSGLGTTSTTPAAALGAGLGAGLASSGFSNKDKPVKEEAKAFYGNNPMGNYNMSNDTWNSLSEEAKESVRNQLKNMGLSDQDIEKIISGEESVPQVAVEAISSSLQEAYANNPEIATYLKEQYGFDIFNEDGTINDDRLALALLMDGGKSNDGFSLIDTLHNKYNIDLVDPMSVTNLSSRLSRVLETDPSLRGVLQGKYGFDIFDENGLVDKDKLTLALLMDNKDPNDGFDLANLLNEKYGQDEVMEELLKNVIKPTTGEDVQQSGMGAAGSIAMGLGLTGAVGGGIAYAKKKQEEEKKEDESIFDEETAVEEQEEEKKEWLSGLGLGILEEEKKEESSSIE